MTETVSIADFDGRSQRARVVGNRLFVSSVVSSLPDPSPFQEPFFRFLDTNGNGTGTKNANGDYSGGEEEFFIQPSGRDLILTRMLITVRDGPGFQSSQYGSGGALGTGIEVQVRNAVNAVDLDCTDDLPVQTNGDWARLCHDTVLLSFGGGDQYLTVRWTFERSGKPIRITKNQRLTIVLNDDLTNLVEHYFNVQGYPVLATN